MASSKGKRDERPPGQMDISQMFHRANKAKHGEHKPTPPAAAAAAAGAASRVDHGSLALKITNRTDKNEFELKLGGGDRAYLQYEYVKAHVRTSSDEMVLDLTHTSVPRDYQGQGLAGLLVKHAFEFAKTQRIQVRPTCTYIGDYVKKNPQWKAALEDKPNRPHAGGGGRPRDERLTAAATPATVGGESDRRDHGTGATAAGGGGSSHHGKGGSRHEGVAPPRPAAAAAPVDGSLHPPGASSRNQRDGDEHSGDKRRSPSADREPSAEWKSKKAKTDEKASGTPAAASAAAAANQHPPKAASALPPHHVPLPFHSHFAKKRAAALSAVTQAIEISDTFRATVASTSGATAPSAVDLTDAIEDVSDLMRNITFSKKELDTRCLGLGHFFHTYLDDDRRLLYLQHTVPFLLQLIVDLPKIFDASRPENANLRAYASGCLPILRTHQSASVSLTKHQIVALLACSFFGLQAEHIAIPRPGQQTVEKRFKSANFDGLWLNIGRQVRHHMQTNDTRDEIRSENQTEVQKMICLMQYFERMRARVQGAQDKSSPNAALYAHILSGVVTFHRKSLGMKASEMEARLSGTQGSSAALPITTQTELRHTGTIEDDGYGTLQIDFANKFLGGGVLTGGCIQEEIRLTINPECLIGLLFVEVMDVDESVTMIGAERFTDYTGYSNSFQYAGDHVDHTPIDPVLNRMKTVIVAIDAIAFRDKSYQYRKENIVREILKAYAGFALEETAIGANPSARKQEQEAIRKGGAIVSYASAADADGPAAASASSSSSSAQKAGVTDQDYSFTTISTGNWGCGAFGAEVPLKAVIQLIAATLARRTLRYFTFGADVCEPLPQLLEVLAAHQPTVKQLYQATLQYHPGRMCGRKTHEYISDLLDGSDLKKQAAYRAQKVAALAQQQATMRPSLQRPNGGAAPTAAAAAAAAVSSASGSARHNNAARSAAADSALGLEDPMDLDPSTDFPDDDEGADGFDSESERVMREMEAEME